MNFFRKKITGLKKVPVTCSFLKRSTKLGSRSFGTQFKKPVFAPRLNQRGNDTFLWIPDINLTIFHNTNRKSAPEIVLRPHFVTLKPFSFQTDKLKQEKLSYREMGNRFLRELPHFSKTPKTLGFQTRTFSSSYEDDEEEAPKPKKKKKKKKKEAAEEDSEHGGVDKAEEEEEGEEEDDEDAIEKKPIIDFNDCYMDGDSPGEPFAELDPIKVRNKIIGLETEINDGISPEREDVLQGREGMTESLRRLYERERREEIEKQFGLTEPQANEPWKDPANLPTSALAVPFNPLDSIWNHYPPPTPPEMIHTRHFGGPYWFWLWWLAWCLLIIYFGKWFIVFLMTTALVPISISQAAFLFFIKVWSIWMWILLAPLFYILTLCGFDRFEWKSFDEYEKIAEERKSKSTEMFTNENVWKYVDSEQTVLNEHQTDPKVWLITKNQRIMNLVNFIMFNNLKQTVANEILEPYEVAGGGIGFISDLVPYNWKMHLSHGGLLHLSWNIVDAETSHRVAVINMEVRQEEFGLWHIERFTMENNLGIITNLQPAQEYIDYHLDVEDASDNIKSQIASDFAFTRGLFSTWGRMARHFGYKTTQSEEKFAFKEYIDALTHPKVQETLYALARGNIDAAERLALEPGVSSGLETIKKYTAPVPSQPDQIKRQLMVSNQDQIQENPILAQTIRRFGGQEMVEAMNNDPSGVMLKTLNTFETVKDLVHRERYNEAIALCRNSDPAVQKGLSQLLGTVWHQMMRQKMDPQQVEAAHSMARGFATSPSAPPEARNEGLKFLAMKQAYEDIVQEGESAPRLYSRPKPEYSLSTRERRQRLDKETWP